MLFPSCTDEPDFRAIVSAVPVSFTGIVYIDRRWILPSKRTEEFGFYYVKVCTETSF